VPLHGGYVKRLPFCGPSAAGSGEADRRSTAWSRRSSAWTTEEILRLSPLDPIIVSAVVPLAPPRAGRFLGSRPTSDGLGFRVGHRSSTIFSHPQEKRSQRMSPGCLNICG
jgi:hypothetical protein